jgi:acetyl esterase/lipase
VSLLAWGLLCLALAAVSHFPPRRIGFLTLAGFFPGWLVAELPWHTATIALLGAAGLAVLAAPVDTAGAAGIGLVVLSVVALLRHARAAAAAPGALAAALVEGGLGAPPAPLGRTLGRLAAIAPLPPPGLERLRNLPYVPGARRRVVDVWRPAGLAPGSNRPALLFIHGGAWVIGNKDFQGLVTVHELASAGWVCYSMNYRLSPRATFPDHLDDVKQAIAWIRAHAAEHGADPRFLVLSGGSAGGHLAALAALTLRGDERVQGCVPYYGVYDLTGVHAKMGSADFRRLLLERLVIKRSYRDHPEVFEAASPICQVHADAPPFFVIHGDNDSLVPVEQARRFVARLREVSRAGVLYAELPGAPHAFEVFHSARSRATVLAVRHFCESLAAARRDSWAILSPCPAGDAGY